MPESSTTLLTRAYYVAKPFLPRAVRWSLRRHRATGIRERHADTWPIKEALGDTPVGWVGWPQGKRFALVLTHDVEGQEGVDKVQALAELEMRCGLRSCFNFIPEGGYEVPESLREWLISNGFEVGVHDLNHDGKLYRSRKDFSQKALRINRYLREWRATGFRSGFMLRELDWLHELEIEYDCSTFDTDPFEPQPDGAHTIFPYWISHPDGAQGARARGGYVELPYTLPQDSTLFLLLKEQDAGIWERKADWIASKGGMVLMNVHPDYIDFEGSGNRMTFGATQYENFLKRMVRQHGDGVWNALPGEVSKFVYAGVSKLTPDRVSWPMKPSVAVHPGIKIWIDLENTPHIPFFLPIIRELQRKGHQVVLTARDGYQTCEMARFHGLNFQRIGRHYGKNLVAKVWGVVVRSLQLLGFARDERPALVLNLGSRSQALAAKFLGIPVAEIMDYEHTAESSFLESRWYLTPEVVNEVLNPENSSKRFRAYRGLKEDVYVPDFKPDPSILDQLNLRSARVVVTIRPAATEAHYHNSESEEILVRVMERMLACPGVKVVLLPRNKRQERELRNTHPTWFDDSKVTIPSEVVNGLNLVWHSDLVISGGGTMNREAAAMGVPVYSIFRGRLGAVDRHLSQQNRLVLIESVTDVDDKIRIEARKDRNLPSSKPLTALKDILGHLDKIIDSLDAGEVVTQEARASL